jgi:hypothetical protein
VSAARLGAVRRHGWHLPLLVAISVLYESRFVGHWLNPTDEGWPLYAAMRLHEGGVLYRDVFFVFPPGHLLAAWIAYALDPPGVVLARVLYASFNVALCVALYLLGRRLMPPSYALFGALLLAVAAPLSHRAQLLFGYRYLVFSVLALLAFARRLRTDRARWMFVAGCCAGVAVCFRLTPAFAVSVGIGVAVVAARSGWRVWLRDWAGYAGGVLVVALPVVAWLAHGAGLATVWQEVVVRPVVMTDLQSLPLPDLTLPGSLDREEVHDAWVALLFRGVALLYAVYAVGLGRGWIRALVRRHPFGQPLLLAVVLWGGIYYLRCLGRSDEPHLSSAIPPFCLLLAHATWTSLGWLAGRGVVPAALRRPVAAAVVGLLLAAWVILPGVDRPFDPGFRGSTPLDALDGAVSLREEDWWHVIGPTLDEVRELAAPGETILDLSAVPLLYVLAERPGPGGQDILMPGTFLDEEEELAFVARLEQAPPAVVVLREKPFDDDESRAVGRTAPRMMQWIARHYAVVGDPEDFLLFRWREPRDFGAP